MSNDIASSRKILQNPYAYLNGDGGYDSPTVSVSRNAVIQSYVDGRKTDSLRVLQNPYAYIGNNEYYVPRNVITNAVIAVNESKHYTGSRRVSGNPYARIPENDDSYGEKIYIRQSAASRDVSNTCKDIEQLARNVHKKIWSNKEHLWPEGIPGEMVEMLDPDVSIKLLGYGYEEPECIVNSNERDDQLAGSIDRIAKRITISRRFKPKIRRFTAAHELGHLVLHDEITMHRDRPIDGSESKRDSIEAEADKFAAFFLMPGKLVRKYYVETFGVEVFALTEDTAYALNPSNPMKIIRQCKNNLRQLSRILAKTEYYNGIHMKSLAERFCVSVETMAIRLEELKLVKL